jgi:DNA-binding GntR family transcriptional regulator
MATTPSREGAGGPGRAPRGSSEPPLYLAVYNALREDLHGGRWELGSSLPSEAELSRQFGVSRITTRHALRLLEAEGYIRKARARRPVVVANAPPARAGWVLESLEDIVAMVADARLDVKSWRQERSADAALFGLEAGTMLHCLRSVLVRADRPYSRSIIYFPPAIGARLSRAAFDDTVVFRVLQREIGVRLDDVQLTIWAEPAAAEDAAALHCEAGAALLVMQLLYREEGGALVEVAYSRSLASEVRLSTRLRTGPRPL